MIDLLIKNGLLVPSSSNVTVQGRSAIAVHESRIIDIGDSEAIEEKYKAAEIVDAKGMAISPGLINCHTHLAGCIFRGLILDRMGVDALYDIAFPMEQLLNPEDIYALSLLGAVECLRFGATTINDIYYSPHQTARAVDEVGMRGVIANKIFDYWLPDIGSGTYKPVTDLGNMKFEENLQLFDDWHGKAEGRITVRLGTHATDTCSVDMLNKSRQAATERGIGLHIHAAQSDNEVNRIRKHYDKTPLEFLNDLEFLGPDVIVVHCTHATLPELDVIAATGTCHASCPTGYIRKGKFPKMSAMLERNITIGTGTDWVRMDPWEAMRSMISGTRLTAGDSEAISTDRAWAMATLESAKILSIESSIGSLEVGKLADIILVDLNQPHMVPLYPDSLLPHLVYNTNGNDVDTSIVNGKVVMRGGCVLTVDHDEVIQNARDVVERIRVRAEQQGLLGPHVSRDPELRKNAVA